MRSVRLAEPVLIWPALVATARSAMNGSSVSPERCDTIAVYPALNAVCMASSVSVRLPIWLTLTRIRIRHAQVDALVQARSVANEQVVADDLGSGADSFIQ